MRERQADKVRIGELLAPFFLSENAFRQQPSLMPTYILPRDKPVKYEVVFIRANSGEPTRQRSFLKRGCRVIWTNLPPQFPKSRDRYWSHYDGLLVFGLSVATFVHRSVITREPCQPLA